MSAANVQWPVPLIREPTLFPGMMGVPGTDNETGLRDHCTGVVFYVDPNFPGANDNRDGTNPTNPLATVGKALTLCQPFRGDVIVVMDNSMWMFSDGGCGIPTAQYTTRLNEEVTVNVSGVRIVGLSAGTVGVTWSPIQDGGTCITVTGTNVIIEGFVFDEGQYTACNAIYAEWNGTTMFADNLTVRNCYFYNSVVAAIDLEHIYSSDIHHNTFYRCTYGIYADPLGGGLILLKAHDNSFTDCVTGAMSLGDTDGSMIYNNRIYNGDAQAGNLATNEGINLNGTSGENMVNDNYFSCILPVGANGDWADLNTGSASDSWVSNHCTDGMAITTP